MANSPLFEYPCGVCEIVSFVDSIDMTEWADDIEDHEYPDPDDYDDDESTETIQCPECRDWVYAEAVTCPSCGYFFTDESRRAQTRPLWWSWVIILIIISFVASFVIF